LVIGLFDTTHDYTLLITVKHTLVQKAIKNFIVIVIYTWLIIVDGLEGEWKYCVDHRGRMKGEKGK
jgi:hypothetical protein